MKSIFQHIRRAVSDVRHFGFGSLARHLAPGRPVGLRGVGKVSLRPSQSDMLCMKQVFVGREYDLSHMPEVDSRIQAGYEALLAKGQVPVIVDAGANIGAASIWYAQRYPEAKIVALEPDPENFVVLVSNTRDWTSVVPVNAAIGGATGHVSVVAGAMGWASQTERASEGVAMHTVEDIVGMVPGGGLFIAKIDIEGFEVDLFADNTDWIADATVIAIEPHDWMMPGKFTSRNFMRAITAHDFEMFISGENLIFVR